MRRAPRRCWLKCRRPRRNPRHGAVADARTLRGGVQMGRFVVSSCVLGAFALWLSAFTVESQDAHPPRPHRHPSAQRLENPVASTPASIAAGRRTYVTLCARCHGPSGKGDGGGAGGGGQPADLTDEVWDHGSSDGEIFVVLRDGTSVDMEGYGERVSETDLWHLVNYLKSLAAAPATPAARGWMPAGVSSRAAKLRAPFGDRSINQ